MSGICLALDNLNPEDAVSKAKEMKEFVDAYKLQQILDRCAFDPNAAAAVQEIQSIGKKVVFDMKVLDIESSMERRLSEYASTGGIVTIHGRTDVSHIRGAVNGIGGTNTKVYVVTSLTSEDETEIAIETGMATKAVILERARKAVLGGAHGIVCSVSDLEFINNYKELQKLERLTPGVREDGGELHDQVRVGTPYYAGRNGSTYAVVGRPILESKKPREAAERISGEFARGLSDRNDELNPDSGQHPDYFP